VFQVILIQTPLSVLLLLSELLIEHLWI